MLARPFNFDSDYQDIWEWWNDWEMCPVLPKYLPQTGIMIENNNEKLCCAFIYRTDSDYCIISWILRNKKANKHNRKNCIDFLIKELIEKTKEMGYSAARFEIDSKKTGITKKLEKIGFLKDDLIQVYTILHG